MSIGIVKIKLKMELCICHKSVKGFQPSLSLIKCFIFTENGISWEFFNHNVISHCSLTTIARPRLIITDRVVLLYVLLTTQE